MSKREICKEIEEMVPAFVLESLDPNERAYVERHLHHCPDCKEAFEDYQKISDGLLQLAPAVSPPPHLRANIAAAITDKPKMTLIDQIGAALRWRGEFTKLSAGLAVAVVVLINILLLTRIDMLRQEQQLLQDQVDRNQTAMAVLTYPTSEVVDFQEETIFGTLVYDPGRPVAVLYAWGLEPLPPNQTYQAWLVEPGGDRASGGIFQPEAGNQFSVVLLSGPQPLEGFVSLGVTVEPAGGSTGPTSDPLLSVDL